MFNIFIISILIFGQSIKLEYKIGGYGFGKDGEFEKTEIIEIIPQKTNTLVKFIQLRNSWKFNSETGKNDKLKIDTILISKKTVSENLINSINHNLDLNANNGLAKARLKSLI